MPVPLAVRGLEYDAEAELLGELGADRVAADEPDTVADDELVSVPPAEADWVAVLDWDTGGDAEALADEEPKEEVVADPLDDAEHEGEVLSDDAAEDEAEEVGVAVAE